MWKRAVMCALIAVAAVSVFADSDDDKIRKAALDYAEGWYSGDAARMSRAIHPDLAKRLATHKADGANLEETSAASLIADVRKGLGKKTPMNLQIKNVSILDRFEGAATVRLEMSHWIDYMHLARFGTEWKIVNVLWEPKPPSRK